MKKKYQAKSRVLKLLKSHIIWYIGTLKHENHECFFSNSSELWRNYFTRIVHRKVLFWVWLEWLTGEGSNSTAYLCIFSGCMIVFSNDCRWLTGQLANRQTWKSISRTLQKSLWGEKNGSNSISLNYALILPSLAQASSSIWG